MELTNYSFLQSRNDYMSTIADRKVTADRIATGKRLENAGEDVGAIHQAAYQTDRIKGRPTVDYQPAELEKVFSMLRRTA